MKKTIGRELIPTHYLIFSSWTLTSLKRRRFLLDINRQFTRWADGQTKDFQKEV